ncbi:hypothetical protein ACFXI6_54740 [Streptomyces mirabilis]|uniref:hypothetical protein n=1 Tax=Streptomyces mirabilis TaxID=68239 RepID=UPI003693D094
MVATAVALVGGGLTVASTDRPSGDPAQAATAPKDPGMGAVQDQAVQDTRPTSTRPDRHPSSPALPAQSPAPDLLRRHYATASLRTTVPSAQPDAAAAPGTTAMLAPQPQATAPSSGGTVTDRTDTAHTTPTQTPTPAATNGTDSGTSQANTAPATTSPSKVCLPVLCLG